MKTLLIVIFAVTALASSAWVEQDPLTGTWQGTLHAGKDLRTVVKISKAAKSGYKLVLYSIDQGSMGANADKVALEASTLKFSISSISGSYEGKLSADGNTITGNWTQGPKPLPLVLTRANADTAWEIPKPPKPMDPNVMPELEVATIKPSNPNVAGDWITVHGREFSIHNWDLNEMIVFAYKVQKKQIVSAPEWVEKDKFDISGVPDHEGVPNNIQLKSMLGILLADRFKLSLHHDQKELSVYLLEIAKNEPKITKNESGGTLPGLWFRFAPGGITFFVTNALIPEFTAMLQEVVLDRPVVDHTGLVGKFDFQLTWAPDDSQFGSRPTWVHHSDQAPPENPLPGLFTAIQEQLGMKLEAAKAPCEVLVIDHVEKPSAN